MLFSAAVIAAALVELTTSAPSSTSVQVTSAPLLAGVGRQGLRVLLAQPVPLGRWEGAFQGKQRNPTILARMTWCQELFKPDVFSPRMCLSVVQKAKHLKKEVT